MTQEIQNTLKKLINSLLSEMENFDPEMKVHSERVAKHCVQFSKEIALPAKEVNQLYVAGLLHDIGMVFIPKDIAEKKERLSDSEMAYIKKHPLISEKIMSKYAILKDLLPIIRYHHESVDGSGYPDGLKGDAIPVGAKILNIVNSFDKIARHGMNGRKVGIEGALAEIERMAGRQFDEALAKGFIKFIRSSDSGTGKEESFQEKVKKPDYASTAETVSIREIIDQIIVKFKKRDAELPVLPEVVHEIQKIISSPSSTINELAEVIEKDAVISVKLISVANSVVYRGTEKISTVKHAIPRLGAKETHSIVATIANKGLYDVRDHYFKGLMEKLWKHSFATALFSKRIAEELRLGDIEKYYLMGLIHDIGKVLLLKVFGDLHYKNDSMDINEIMENVKEVHTSFGSSILRKWGFSEEYVRVCLLHEGPRYKEGTDNEILIVNLAGNMAKKAGFGVMTKSEQVNLSTLDSIILLDIDQDTVYAILEDTKETMENTSNIFS